MSLWTDQFPLVLSRQGRSMFAHSTLLIVWITCSFCQQSLICQVSQHHLIWVHLSTIKMKAICPIANERSTLLLELQTKKFQSQMKSLMNLSRNRVTMKKLNLKILKKMIMKKVQTQKKNLSLWMLIKNKRKPPS